MRAPIRKDVLEALGRELAGLGRKDRAARLAERASVLGLSVPHLRRQVKQHQEAQQGKARAKAPSRVVTPEQAQLIARTMQATEDERKQIKLAIPQTVRTLQRDGQLPPAEEWSPSFSTIRRALQDLGLSRQNLSSRGFAIRRITERPNDCHLVDMSICRQYYLRPDGLTAAHEHPQYKPEHEATGRKRKLWRYLLVDHYSGAVFVQYFHAAGENPADVVRFLHQAWDAGTDLRAELPFHGVPKRVLADQGAAFKATTTQNLLRVLDVDIELHAAGNARASGSVERAHEVWEAMFETRLRFRPARSLEELNERALEQCIELNCAAEYAHRRHGQPRVLAWLDGMTAELLRLPPDWRRFARLASANPVTRTVDEYGCVSVDNQPLELGGNVYAREKVTILEYPYAEDRWRALSCRDEELTVTPLRRNAGGFLVGGRSHVIGSEGGAQHPHNLSQRLRAEDEETPAWLAEPFARTVDPDALPAAPEGAAALSDVDLPPSSLVDALRVRMRARDRLQDAGVEQLPLGVAEVIDARVGDGVPADQVEALLDDVLSELETSSLNHWFGRASSA